MRKHSASSSVCVSQMRIKQHLFRYCSHAVAVLPVRQMGHDLTRNCPGFYERAELCGILRVLVSILKMNISAITFAIFYPTLALTWHFRLTDFRHVAVASWHRAVGGGRQFTFKFDGNAGK